MAHPRIYVDFGNIDSEGRVRLNCPDTVADLNVQGIQLKNQLVLTIYSEKLETDAFAEYSHTDKCWVAVVGWDRLPT